MRWQFCKQFLFQPYHPHPSPAPYKPSPAPVVHPAKPVKILPHPVKKPLPAIVPAKPLPPKPSKPYHPDPYYQPEHYEDVSYTNKVPKYLLMYTQYLVSKKQALKETSPDFYSSCMQLLLIFGVKIED